MQVPEVLREPHSTACLPHAWFWWHRWMLCDCQCRCRKMHVDVLNGTQGICRPPPGPSATLTAPPPPPPPALPTRPCTQAFNASDALLVLYDERAPETAWHMTTTGVVVSPGDAFEVAAGADERLSTTLKVRRAAPHHTARAACGRSSRPRFTCGPTGHHPHPSAMRCICLFCSGSCTRLRLLPMVEDT